jgi:hypothetical protein
MTQHSENRVHRTLAGWNAVPSGPFFELQEPPEELLAEAVPSDYLLAIRSIGGREGFLGQQYLRLYRYGELLPLNQAYELPDYNPEIFIFAADGSGEAFGFVFGTDTVVKIPLIPIPADQADIVANGFVPFLDVLAKSGTPPELDQAKVGLELHLKQPLCFGGDFRDPNNVVMVPPAKHAELASYWNKVYYDLKAREERS